MAASEEMADSKHLAKTIKKIHSVLRSNVRNAEENFEKVWGDHKSNLENLQTYADAMEKLSRSWTETHPSIENRIEWCRNVCKDYFHEGGLEKALEKEQKKIYHQKLRDKEIVEQSFEKFYQTRKCDFEQNKWKTNSTSSKILLDVGSCFNPFQNFQDEFDVVAIDLCPASSSGVFQADFLEISVISQEREGTEPKKRTSHEAETSHDVQMDSKNTMNNEIEPLEEVTARRSSGKRGENLAAISKDSLDSADCLRDAECGEQNEEKCLHGSTIDEIKKEIGIKQGHKLEERQEYLSTKGENPAPAIERLKLSLTQPISELPAGFFDVVVFSLFLSYFPIPKLRWDCCVKANRLLSRQGLLLLIESDSAHLNRNSKQIKSWKIALESIGFVRYKYEKLAHLHCMAFRKSKEVTEPPNHAGMMFIPQDFHDETEEAVSEPLLRDESTNEEVSELFEELPNF